MLSRLASAVLLSAFVAAVLALMRLPRRGSISGRPARRGLEHATPPVRGRSAFRRARGPRRRERALVAGSGRLLLRFGLSETVRHDLLAPRGERRAGEERGAERSPGVTVGNVLVDSAFFLCRGDDRAIHPVPVDASGRFTSRSAS
jgi:hypothetical protein